ncbi:MAG: ATP-dependent endonuclease [Caldimonas sp.]
MDDRFRGASTVHFRGATSAGRHDANVEPPATTPRPPGPRPPLAPDDARRLVSAARAHAAILVEGWSDQAALEALARRRGRDLQAEGIVVVPIGGATNLQRFVQALGPQGLGVRLAGLCDIAEMRHVRRGLEGAGMTENERIEDHGFYVCDADLEDELIRALGTDVVERVLDAEGELASFRRFQDQPAQRGRDLHAQLRRFLGTRAGRKVRYGSLLVDALALDRVPPALDLALARVRG